MVQPQSTQLVAVYRSEPDARHAAEIAQRAGAPPDAIRVGEDLDRVVSLEGEMREEMDHTVAGPGNFGPFTEEMTKGMSLGMAFGAVFGLIVALPFAAIPFGDFELWLRLVIVGVVGVTAGGTAGWVIGGGFGAKRPDETLAAERGVTLSVPDTPAIEEALVQTHALRIDVVTADGQPLRTLTSEPSEAITYALGRNAAEEDRRS